MSDSEVSDIEERQHESRRVSTVMSDDDGDDVSQMDDLRRASVDTVNTVNTFLSDEEELEGDFLLRRSDLRGQRRKSSKDISGITSRRNWATSGVQPQEDEGEFEGGTSSARLPSEDLVRAAPGEIDSSLSETIATIRPQVSLISDELPPSCMQRSHRLSTVSSSGPAANIQVACRFRPLISREIAAGDFECDVKIFTNPPSPDTEGTSGAFVAVNGKTFTMDRVFSPDASQSEVYDAVARPVVQDVLEGYNGTVMAYGSTGSGKTYTMEGRTGNAELVGIIPRMVSTLFDGIDVAADNIEFTLKLSAVEIYMERIIDLLRPQSCDHADGAGAKVKVREDPVRGVWVDAVERHAANEEDVFAVAHASQANRRVAATHLNVRSSRSHYILMLRLTALDKQTQCERQGVLYLVDLAGCENVSQTGAAGQILEEAKKINRSLSCLGNVIVALTGESQRQHVPYRDSKLTRVLQQSLGGNAKTALIATCSLAKSCFSETLTTLRFGERVKCVRNTPKVNEQRSVEQLLRDLSTSTRIIEALKRDVETLRKAVNFASPTRSIGTLTSEVHDQAGACVQDAVLADGTHSDMPPPEANQALQQMQAKLEQMKRERDSANDQLSQVRSHRLELARLKRKQEAVRRTDVDPGLQSTAGHSDAMRKLEAENKALRFQVAKLTEASAARAEEERKLKEEVFCLRDAAMRSAQKVEFLQCERNELNQLLETSYSGDADKERRQWQEVLNNEAARREAACEQWRAYLSNRVHKIVQLEIEAEFLRDALASLEKGPDQLGADIMTLLGVRNDCEVRSAGVDFDGSEIRESLLLEHDGWENAAKPGCHANVAQPVVRRRRRQRSCERQLPGSPALQSSESSPWPTSSSAQQPQVAG